ncbi:hypothetical protein M3Y97_01168100 [Aphelenchoides bicaudatus]|nr:hypothetical protein M3Y97_01168100 [Aphelenchoides bicaudatus]
MADNEVCSSKAGQEFKAVSVLNDVQIEELNKVDLKKKSAASNFGSGDQLVGEHSTQCSGGGWYAPCDGNCWTFTDVNSILLLGEKAHTISLYQGAGCSGIQHIYAPSLNVCYNGIPPAQSARCY